MGTIVLPNSVIIARFSFPTHPTKEGDGAEMVFAEQRCQAFFVRSKLASDGRRFGGLYAVQPIQNRTPKQG